MSCISDSTLPEGTTSERKNEHDLLESICLSSLSNSELIAYLSEPDDDSDSILRTDPIERIVELTRIPWQRKYYLDALIEICNLVELHARPNLSIRNKMDIVLTIVNEINDFKQFSSLNPSVIRSIYSNALTNGLATIRRENTKHQNLMDCAIM
jgi:hypothetical protein